MLYKELLTPWLEDQRRFQKISTFANYANIIHSHLLPDLGESVVDDLNSQFIQEYVLRLLDSLSPSYVKGILILIKTTLPHSIDIKLPYTPPKEIQIFERESQIKMMNHLITNELNPMNFGILLTIHTGIRIGELCGLQWQDFDLAGRTLTIRRTVSRVWVKGEGSKLIIRSPKSRSSLRTIPLNHWIMEYVGFLAGSPEAYILTGLPKPKEPDKYRRFYKRVLKELDIPYLKFHCLRHTFATRSIECGCDYKSLSLILGHANVSITMQLYVHPQMELKRKCVELLAAYYADV